MKSWTEDRIILSVFAFKTNLPLFNMDWFQSNGVFVKPSGSPVMSAIIDDGFVNLFEDRKWTSESVVAKWKLICWLDDNLKSLSLGVLLS